MHADTAVLDLVMDWEDRRDRGESVALEEVCAAVPHLAAEVRRLIQALTACDRLLALVPSAAVAPPPTPPPAPARVGGYDIQGELGRGGMGVVYRAWDPALCRAVAVKTLHPAMPAPANEVAQRAARFRREGQVLARLRHEAIVPVYEAKLADDGPYFVMECVPGGSLADYRERLTAKGPAAVAAFLERVARGVAHAHAQGVLHRDLKPGNILIDADGRPKVSDFGLAKLLGPATESLPPAAVNGEADTAADAAVSQLTVPGHQPGTWAYMAPEQFDPGFGPVGPPTDVWALGVILYELLTGRRPFPGRTWADLRDQVCHRVGPPTVRTPAGRRVGRRLEQIVRRCLARDPARRFRSAGELADALRRAAAPRRGWQVVAAVGLVLAGVVAAGFWFRPPVEAPAAWPELPAVRDAQARLVRGEEVGLVDGGPPAAFALPFGPASGQVLAREDGLFSVHSTRACLVELLPALPAGRYRVEAELRHERAEGRSVIGAYAAGGRGLTDRGRQALFAALTFSDLGSLALSTQPGEAGGVARLAAHHLGEDPSKPWVGGQVMAASRPFPSAQDLGRPADWRWVALQPGPDGVAAWFGDESLGTVAGADLEESRAAAGRRDPAAAAALRVTPDGAVGVYLFNGTVTVRRFRVRPVPPAE